MNSFCDELILAPFEAATVDVADIHYVPANEKISLEPKLIRRGRIDHLDHTGPVHDKHGID